MSELLVIISVLLSEAALATCIARGPLGYLSICVERHGDCRCAFTGSATEVPDLAAGLALGSGMSLETSADVAATCHRYLARGVEKFSFDIVENNVHIRISCERVQEGYTQS